MNKTVAVMIVFISALMFIFGFLFAERIVQFRVPHGNTLIRTAVLDSIRNLKPIVDVKDSIVYRDTIIYKDRPIPVPIPQEMDINYYSDSLINDSTYLVINDWVKGTIEKREIEIRPSLVIRTINTPYPVFFKEENNFIPPKMQIYGDFIVGGNSQQFLTGLGVGFINKNQAKFGFQFQTDFDQKQFLVTYGKSFFIY